MELMTIGEAARGLGYKSRSQLYRLLNNDYLHWYVHVQQHTRHRLVEIEGTAGEAAAHLPMTSWQRFSKAQRDRRLSTNVVPYTAILVQYRDI